MRAALAEAQKASDKQEVPIGAVVVCNDVIIARGHNLTETLRDPTAHAEMQAITAATDWLGGKYLIDCTIYVTIEPCGMCAGAIGWTALRASRGRHGPAPEPRLGAVVLRWGGSPGSGLPQTLRSTAQRAVRGAGRAGEGSKRSIGRLRTWPGQRDRSSSGGVACRGAGPPCRLTSPARSTKCSRQGSCACSRVVG
jgi:hypothetical protein